MNEHRKARLSAGITFRDFCIQNGMEPSELHRIEAQGEPTPRLIDKLPAFINPDLTTEQVDALIAEIKAITGATE